MKEITISEIKKEVSDKHSKVIYTIEILSDNEEKKKQNYGLK